MASTGLSSLGDGPVDGPQLERYFPCPLNGQYVYFFFYFFFVGQDGG